MADSNYEPATTTKPGDIDKGAVPSMTDRTPHVDRCFQVLADRRRRFCLYYLDWASTPVTIRDLTLAVEIAISPPDATLTQETLDDAIAQFIHTHLPKLRDAGLVRVDDKHVDLRAEPPVPILDWLNATAVIEHDTDWAYASRGEQPTPAP